MTRQNISTGSAANDGTGDTLRTAGTKINDNFVELYRFLGGGDSNNLSSQISFEDSSVVFEGSSTDDFEMRLGTQNPTADRVVLLPNASGTISLTSATETLTNKTLTRPVLTDPKLGLAIKDSDNANMILFTRNGPAINHLHVENNTASNPVKLSAIGTDTNINLQLNSKGTGSVEIDKAAYSSVEITADGAASTAASFIICNKGSALAVSLADGTTTGEYKIFTNKGAGVATVTPANFAAGTSFALAQNEGAQCVWDGTNWFLIGNQSVTTVA
jgi:hypothetical protein